MIDRRHLIRLSAALAALVPVAAAAQPHRWKIGILALSDSSPVRRAIERALDRRWPGSAAVATFIERHSAEVTALPQLARELVAADVDVIVARLTPAALAAKTATSTVPIVATMGAAVEAGIAASLAEPGRNITGISSLTPETTGKLVEIAREAFPGATRFGFLANASDPLTPVLVEHVMNAARQAGAEVLVEAVSGTAGLDEAVRRLVAAKVAAAILQPSLPARVAITKAHAAGLPILGAVRTAIDLGALVSYATHAAEIFELLGDIVVQVLAGTRPADIPIRQPTRFELAVNLKAARMLGITLPAAFLARADEVIE